MRCIGSRVEVAPTPAGYSLIRKIIEAPTRPDLDAGFHGRPLRDVILRPTRPAA